MATTKVTRASVKLALKLKAEAEGGCGGEFERVAGWQHQTNSTYLVFSPSLVVVRYCSSATHFQEDG
jgi:hypothetical protein